MTRIIPSLDSIAASYDALYCDLWGCVHDGMRPYPAAIAALARFKAAGGRVALMTNAPRPANAVQRMLDRMGVPRDVYDLIVSSGDAAQEAMMQGAVGRNIWHLGPEKDHGFFNDLPDWLRAMEPVKKVAFDLAEGIICTGPFDEMTETPEDYRGTFLAAKARGLKLLCANPDIVVDYGDKRIYCAGALAQLYEEMGGESLYYGKPHPPIYDLARRGLAAIGHDIPDERILAVGDGIFTDVQGGVAEGIDSLFITGGLAAEEFGTDVENPDETLLRHWLESQGPRPTYAIGRLR